MSKRRGETIQAVRRKIRIVSSSSSEDELSNRPNDLEDLSGSQIPMTDMDVPLSSSSTHEGEESRLDDDVLALLGDAPKSDVVLGKPIHKDISERWREILSKGLEKETKENIFREYLIPSNCEMLLAPKLNAETKAAMVENIVKRDYALEAKQHQIGIALAALSTAIDSVVKKDFTPQKLLKPISDACRILCDSHFNETKTRRHFILSSINSEMKETLSETVRDKYLFGENITDKLKSAKIIKKSGTDLKPTTTASYNRQKFNKNNFIKNRYQGQSNWRSLQRRTGKADAGSVAAQNQPRSYNTRSGPQHREAARSPPPPPPPRPQQRARRRHQ